MKNDIIKDRRMVVCYQDSTTVEKALFSVVKIIH